METNEMMKAILSRVLSQEIAHQEIWKKEAIEKWGVEKVDRDKIVKEIKSWMEQNEIKFNYDWYIREF
jgi:hypothetical protein